MPRKFNAKRKEEPDAQLRIAPAVARRLEAWLETNDKGCETRNEAATYAIVHFLDAEEARQRRKQAWDAWVEGGRKGLAPPVP